MKSWRIKALSNSNQLERDFEKFVANFSRKGNMTKIAKAGASIIKKRARTAGKDVNDNVFKELADSTARTKMRGKGGKVKKDGSVPRKYYRSILTETKAMLDSIKGKGIAKNVGMIYLNDEYEIKKASWNEKLGRIFFGISNKDEKKLSIFINELFRKQGDL